MNIIEASKAKGRVRPKVRYSGDFRHWGEWVDKAHFTILGDLMDVEWEEERKVEMTESQLKAALFSSTNERKSFEDVARELGLRD